jgi:phosphate transport system substrate-binding protein
VDIANASRSIKPEEIEEANAQGIEPYEMVVANDAIAVIVNPENPVDHLTLEQVSQIYQGHITNWKEVGGEDRPIVSLSRETNSGTHVYFLETVVRLGDARSKPLLTRTLLLPLPRASSPRCVIIPTPSVRRLGYVTSEVKMLGLGEDGMPSCPPQKRSRT